MQTRHAAPMRGFCIIERGVIHNAGAHERFRASHNTGELLTDNDLKTERATEPPKRWRNWYRAKARRIFDGHPVEPGFVGASQSVWPSREVAETMAYAKSYTTDGTDFFQHYEYLGAFPDGETP